MILAGRMGGRTSSPRRVSLINWSDQPAFLPHRVSIRSPSTARCSKRRQGFGSEVPVLVDPPAWRAVRDVLHPVPVSPCVKARVRPISRMAA